MKSIQYTEHGSDYDAMLQLVDDGVAADAASTPPSSGFATVKIVAASGNPIDFKVAQGGLKGAWDCPLPMAMGYDFLEPLWPSPPMVPTLLHPSRLAMMSLPSIGDR